MEPFVASNNQFGFDLLALLAQENPQQNVFISPSSVVQALAMTANGADAATAVALRAALRLHTLDWSAIHRAQAAIWHDLRHDEKALVLRLTNAVWTEPRFPFAPAFREAVARYYQARIDNLDFSDPAAAAVVNAWVAQQTEGKIKDLLASGDLRQAVMVLVNAIYFKGLFRTPFDKTRTQNGRFHLANRSQKTVPFMTRSGQFHYRQQDGWQMVSLPFGENGRLSLVMLLPAADVTLSQKLSALTTANWASWLPRLLPGWGEGTWNARKFGRGQQQGTVTMPRFQLGYRASLLSKLEQMGLTANNFSSMSAIPDDLFISKIIHQTVLEVTEAGAEAAAATAVIVARSAVFPRPFHMTVDRPFACAIQDNKSGLILFVGLVYDPELIP